MIAFFLTYISAVSGGGRFAFFNHLAGIKQNAFESVITRILLGISPDHLKTPKAYATRLDFWLISSEIEEKEKTSENPVNRFLTALDAFDLNAYIKSIRFDE